MSHRICPKLGELCIYLFFYLNIILSVNFSCSVDMCDIIIILPLLPTIILYKYIYDFYDFYAHITPHG